MQKREKILAGVVGGLVALWLLPWLFQTILQGPLNDRYARRDAIRKRIEDKERILRRARQDSQKLIVWQTQSLPSGTDVARSLYQNWLLELVERAGFVKPNVDSGEAVAKKGIYHKLPFSVRGRANLSQLTRFLYDFYRADHLHQIQRLSITPLGDSSELELAISIEALVLPDADRRDQLTNRRSTRLAFESLADYQVIEARNIFGLGGGSTIDAADLAFLTAILDIDGQPEAWFTLRSTGEVLKLRVGQTFDVGQFRGTVAEIDAPDLVIDSDDERWLLTLGESLSQATALPPEF